MKQRIFTLLMMFVLVIMAGSAMAQGTWNAPYIGESHTYTFPVVNADYSFIVTTGSTSPTDGAVSPGTIFTISGASGSGVTGNATATIVWLDPAVNNTYYVWLSATYNDGTETYSCPVYRRVQVNPKAFDIIIEDITSIYASGTWTTVDASTNVAATCPSGVVDYDNSSFDPGTTTLYFRVTRTDDAATPAPLASAEAWAFTLGISDNSASDYSSPTIVVTDGLGGAITPSGSVYTIPAASSTAFALVAVTYANEYVDGAVTTTFTTSLTSCTSGGTSESTANAANLNSTTHILNGVPGIGVFTGN